MEVVAVSFFMGALLSHYYHTKCHFQSKCSWFTLHSSSKRQNHNQGVSSQRSKLIPPSLLQIPQPKSPECQYTTMLEELELSVKPFYTAKNLPIVLNQFYLDRLQELVQLKHMMLLRWTRLAIGRPKVTEELLADYHKRIEWVGGGRGERTLQVFQLWWCCLESESASGLASVGLPTRCLSFAEA